MWVRMCLIQALSSLAITVRLVVFLEIVGFRQRQRRGGNSLWVRLGCLPLAGLLVALSRVQLLAD